jgi:Uma2 family endonuclease
MMSQQACWDQGGSSSDSHPNPRDGMSEHVIPTWTAADLYRLDLGGRLHELVQGVLVAVPSPTPAQARARQATRRLLERHGRRTGGGLVLPEGSGLLTQRQPDTVRTADLAFHPNPRWWFDPGDAPQLIPEPPDLVVLVPPEDRSQDETIRHRVHEYLDAGVLMIWTVHLDQQLLTIDRDDEPTLHLERHRQIADLDELPGFAEPVLALFG